MQLFIVNSLLKTFFLLSRRLSGTGVEHWKMLKTVLFFTLYERYTNIITLYESCMSGIVYEIILQSIDLANRFRLCKIVYFRQPFYVLSFINEQESFIRVSFSRAMSILKPDNLLAATDVIRQELFLMSRKVLTFHLSTINCFCL